MIIRFMFYTAIIVAQGYCSSLSPQREETAQHTLITPYNLIPELCKEGLFPWMKTIAKAASKGVFEQVLSCVHETIISHDELMLYKWITRKTKDNTIVVLEETDHGEWASVMEITNSDSADEGGMKQFLTRVEQYLRNDIQAFRQHVEKQKESGQYDKSYSTEKYIRYYLYYKLSYY